MTTAAEPRGEARDSRQYEPWQELLPLPESWVSLPSAFVHAARRHAGRVAICDSTGVSYTYAQTFLRTLAMGRVLSRTWGNASHVGLFVPPVAPSAMANLAVSLWGRIPVNLNYSASQSVVDSSIEQCGITHVITSGRALDKFKITPRAELILLEDLPARVTLADKLWAAAVSQAVPLAALPMFLPGLRGNRLDDEATIIFTSGSTGDPKGVRLSHRNILSNAHQIDQQVQMKPDDVVLGILPFFHAFGFTVTIWTALALGKKVVYHFNPLDARNVGKLCEDHGVTLLIGTPSFMRIYLKTCEAKQFAKLTHLILGAEKLKPELAREIERTLGIRPLEGYGCTELSPVVAVNVPESVQLRDGRSVDGNRLGTVGLPMPGTRIKTVDPETGEDLAPGTEGMIQVSGPQVMMGYLNRPEATARVLSDGWYTTGDLGALDEDGFLRITDRLSRFSKVAGEMVPHILIESALMELTGVDEHHVAVTGVPDDKHGERLCVLYTDLGMSPTEVHHRMMDGRIPRLWIPSVRDFIQVDEIPITATGKIDLRGLRELATSGHAPAQPAGSADS